METVPGRPETAEDQAFTQHEQAQEANKEADYTKALNQKGEQEIEQAQGAEKGAAGFEAPTLADTLPPEQQEALRTFAQRRAEAAPERPPPTAEERVLPYVEPKGGAKGFQSLQERRLAQGLEVPAGLEEAQGPTAEAAPRAEPTILGQTKAGAKERGSISNRPIEPKPGGDEKATPEERVKAANTTLRQAWGEAYDKTIGSSKVAELGRKAVLQFEGNDKLQGHTNPEVAPRLHKEVGGLDRLRQDQEGFQKNLKEEDWKNVDAAVKWKQENPKLAGKLDDLAHESTNARTDPSKEFKPLYSDETKAADSKKAAADEARETWLEKRGKPLYDALGPEGQQHYKNFRDWYEKRGDAVDNAMVDRMREMGMDEDKIKDLKDFLNKTSGRIEPYFPLKRYGKLWARTRDAEGNTTGYIRRDEPSEIKQWIDEQAKAQGFRRGDKATTGELRAEHGTALDDVRAESERVAPKFLKDIVDMVPDEDLKTEIYRRYINSLPEGHYLKSKLPRAGTPGYSNDAIRAFATHAIATGRALASLKFAHKFDMKLEDIKEATRELEQQHSANPDPLVHNEAQWGAEIVNRLTKGKQLDWLKSPHNAEWTQKVSGIAFHSVLGVMPSTAGKILLQNPVWASAKLSGEHGFFQAELSKQSGKYVWRNMVAPILNKTIETVTGSEGHLETELRGDDRTAVEMLGQRGMWMSDFTHMMTDAATTEKISKIKSPTEKAKQWTAWASKALFQGGEDFVRKTTALAAFRLKMKELGAAPGDPMAIAKAVDHAYKLTQGSHVDYSPANTPPIMQSNAGKIALMFHKYTFSMIYNLARNLRDSTAIQSLPPGERAIAIKTFLGTLGNAYIVGGTHMIPGLTAAVGWIASKVLSDDPDHPVDGETELRNFLELKYGAKGMQTILGGALGAAGIAPIGGLTELFYQPPGRNETAKQQAEDFATRLGGPVVGQAIDAVQGAEYLSKGDYQRAGEHLPIRGLHGPLQAERFAREGVRSPGQMPGNETLSPQEISAADLIKKTLGFTPLDLSERYDLNTGRQNDINDAYTQEKDIIQRYAVAAALNQPKEMARIVEKEMEPFMKANPNFDIVEDVQRFINEQATGEHGVGIPMKMRNQVLEKFPETPRTLAERRAAAANEEGAIR